MVEEHVEPWELRSGTWLRDRVSETWRLATMRDGTMVDPRLPSHDLARLIGSSRDPATGEWFPPDFKYSQHTGAPLQLTMAALDEPWVPPFGASALSVGKPLARGLRQTRGPLALARAPQRSADGAPDRTLPPLPPGQYRFVADKFGVACQSLIAFEPEQGKLVVLLPESKRWLPLERTAGPSWGQGLRNPRGWRVELVHVHGRATAYLPSSTGLAAITPNALGLCYAVEHAGDGAAIGGPVPWGGEIWAPVLGKGGTVQLVGKPHGTPRHLVLPTPAPVPQQGFEAPVFDDLHVNWPCAEGQLVLRLDKNGNKQCDWIPWPETLEPLFAMGCPYTPLTGTFWQLCRRTQDERFVYVQMARAAPHAAFIDALRLCTGRASYRGSLRIDGDPWHAAQGAQAAPLPDPASTEIVVPLLESANDSAVIGLRMDAPHGVPDLLQAGDEVRRAVLQVELPGQGPVAFGTLEVKRPWLALPFVYDGHLWIDHPDLRQVAGWKLAS